MEKVLQMMFSRASKVLKGAYILRMSTRRHFEFYVSTQI